MGQVTIYLDDDCEAKLNAAVQAQHISKSKWISNVIQEKLANSWPASIVDLAGSWQDFPEAESLRNNSIPDSAREAL